MFSSKISPKPSYQSKFKEFQRLNHMESLIAIRMYVEFIEKDKLLKIAGIIVIALFLSVLITIGWMIFAFSIPVLKIFLGSLFAWAVIFGACQIYHKMVRLAIVEECLKERI